VLQPDSDRDVASVGDVDPPIGATFEPPAQWVRRTQRPAGPLVGRCLARDLVGFEQARPPDRLRILPSPTVTLMLQLGEPFAGLPAAFVRGVSLEPTSAAPGGVIECVDLKLTPPGAHLLFGVSMAELAGRAVDLGDLVGESRVARLLSRVASAGSWVARLEVAEAFLLELASTSRTSLDPRAGWCWDELCRTGGQARIGRLADEIGWSHRHLVAEFRRLVGVTPKQAARIVRFHHTTAVLRQSPPARRLAVTAVECGYYDQSHLCREFLELGGMTPAEAAAGL